MRGSPTLAAFGIITRLNHFPKGVLQQRQQISQLVLLYTLSVASARPLNHSCANVHLRPGV